MNESRWYRIGEEREMKNTMMKPNHKPIRLLLGAVGLTLAVTACKTVTLTAGTWSIVPGAGGKPTALTVK